MLTGQIASNASGSSLAEDEGHFQELLILRSNPAALCPVSTTGWTLQNSQVVRAPGVPRGEWRSQRELVQISVCIFLMCDPGR